MFDSAKLKIQWANAHIKQLDAVIRQFMQTDFYTFSNERDRKTGLYQISVKSNRLPPSDIYLLLGDIIHNLRTSLDHAATEIVGDGSYINFPFHEQRRSFIREDGTIICNKVNLIEGAIANLGRFIVDEIKPYRDGNYNLWSVTKLDAIDKHKFLIPAVALTSVTAFDLYDNDNHNNIGQMTGKVGPGGVVNLVGSLGQYEVRGEIQPAFEVLFTKDTFFEDQPIVKTLIDISNVVSETLGSVEEFITKAK